MTLTQDIISVGKGRQVYGRKGDKVTLIASHDNVLIVQGKERFPVKRELVIENH